MTDYKNLPFRAVDVGLNLRDSVDKVGEGQWIKLQNVRSTQEALLDTREGRTLEVNTGSGLPVHSLTRLDDSTLLSGSGTALYRNSTPYTGAVFSGSILSIVPFQPEASTEVWAYIGDTSGLWKVAADGSIYKWGVTKPTTVIGAGGGGAGNLDSSVPGGIAYYWVYTYYSSRTGAESDYSPEMAAGLSLTASAATLTVTASADPQVDTIRIYRKGGTLTTYRLSVETPNLSGSITDNNADSSLALQLALPTDSYVPFTSEDSNGDEVLEVPLPHIWGPFIGKYLFAIGDENRKGAVYWTNPGRPDTADPDNYLIVTSPAEPLVNGCVFNGQPFVFSRDDLYALDFGGPNTLPQFTSRQTMCGKGLIAPHALATGPLIYFVAQDGIYSTDGQGPAQPLTELTLRPIFDGIDTAFYSAVDMNETANMRLSYVGNELHFFYTDTGGDDQHLVYHTLYERWKNYTSADPSRVYQFAYEDENQTSLRILYGCSCGSIFLEEGTTDAGTAINVSCVTGYNDFGLPHTLKEIGNIIVDADPGGGTITITPLVNAVGTVNPPALTITGSGRQKFPLSMSDIYCYSLAFKFEWTGTATLYQMEILWRPDEEELTHWEYPETTHGMRGWQHVRDVYIDMRATSDVTLTIENDGNAEAYTLASTSGERRKIHQWLHPRKGKVWRYKLDATGSGKFRLYGEECEVNVKEWNTALGFKLVSPFVPDSGGT